MNVLEIKNSVEEFTLNNKLVFSTFCGFFDITIDDLEKAKEEIDGAIMALRDLKEKSELIQKQMEVDREYPIEFRTYIGSDYDKNEISVRFSEDSITLYIYTCFDYYKLKYLSFKYRKYKVLYRTLKAAISETNHESTQFGYENFVFYVRRMIFFLRKAKIDIERELKILTKYMNENL